MLRINLIKGELGHRARNLASAYRCAKRNPEKTAENKRRWAANNMAKMALARKSWQEAHPELYRRVKRDSRLRVMYGITLSQYEEMLRAQNDVCAICKGQQNNPRSGCFDVDHSHTTGKVRALLCNDCNKKLAVLENDPEWLKAAQSYLERHRAS